MRSPQLGQKLVSVKGFPVASLAVNGYHLRPMDARGWMVRLALGVGLAGGLGAQARAQTPTPTPSVTAPTGSPTPTATLAPSGAPKILLAFDASGSMLTDDGKGTRKIDAAKEAAVALLDTLPDSTEVGLRLFGGTKPSRPIGPACQDSSLVLPLGRVDRGEAESSIRAFKARGRTPIAYALEQAADDLGTGGSRTIVLVSDGKDTCQPPAPCDVAEEISKGGVELRIQAIGFRVDEEARRELECIAAAGGGVYRDATDAASLRQELRVLSTRALRQYVARGAATKGGPSSRQATVLKPGRYVDKMLPDTEHWFAVDLARGETLKASVSFIPPDRTVEDQGTDSSLDIVTPDFDIPGYQNSSAGGTPFDRRGYVSALGVVSRPVGVGEQADAGAKFSEPGRYYLKVGFKDSSEKSLFNATGGQPYDAELAVEVLGRSGDKAKDPEATPTPVDPASFTPQEPPSAGVLTVAGGGLAAAGFAAAVALGLRRRRP
jgi:Ca-activated chloride channel family protein